MLSETVYVPSECLPALLGLEGKKHKDTERVSKTKIRFKRVNSDSYNAKIFGKPDNIILAKQIIDVAIKHFKASVSEDSQEDPALPGKDEAVLDCNMFISETLRRKCY